MLQHSSVLKIFLLNFWISTQQEGKQKSNQFFFKKSNKKINEKTNVYFCSLDICRKKIKKNKKNFFYFKYNEIEI